MKNKKTIPIILIILILILGITSFGVSWFTLKSNVTSNLILNTGSADVTVEGSRWILRKKELSEVTNKDANNNFNNVKPGDSFVKAVTFRNSGSLKQKLSFEINEELPEGLRDFFKLYKKDTTSFILQPNETKEISIATLTLITGTQDNFQNDYMDFSLLDTEHFIKVRAIQVNVPKNNVIKFLGLGNSEIASLDFNFLEGKIKATSTGNQAHSGFGSSPYITLEITNDKGQIKTKSLIKGTDTGNNFAAELNNITFNTGDIILVTLKESDRGLISYDSGNHFIKLTKQEYLTSTMKFKISNTGLQRAS